MRISLLIQETYSHPIVLEYDMHARPWCLDKFFISVSSEHNSSSNVTVTWSTGRKKVSVRVSVNKALLGWISIKQALLSLVFLHIQHHTMGDSDPFECRLTFLSLLEKLNASQQSITKVANYAVRHRKVAEDLYRCLVDELEQVIVFFFFFPLETGCAARI